MEKRSRLLSMTEEEINHKYTSSGFNICVVGMGYVGTVVASLFSDQGQKVIGLESSPQVVESINKGSSHIYEPGLSEILRRSVEAGRLRATDSPASAVSPSDLVVITVGTPIDEDHNVVFDYLESAARSVGKNLSPGSLVVLKSTVPPLTTEKKVAPIIEEESGMKAVEFGLAFIPERTVEGRAVSEMRTLPKIVGGIDEDSTRVAAALFGKLGGRVVKVSSPREAEAAKLFDNIYRDVNIALANELAILCESAHVDYVEASNAANTEYKRTNLLMPGPGVGGSCLTKDPYIFLQSAGEGSNKARMIPTGRDINDRMPEHVLDLVRDGLSDAGKELSESQVAVLGYAFKGDTDDTRNTPVSKLLHKLKEEGAQTPIFDPHVKSKSTVGSIEAAVRDSDCVLLATDHPEFKDLDPDRLASLARGPLVIVDTRAMIDPKRSLKYIYRGIGRPPSSFLR